MTARVFVDANILFSAAYNQTSPAGLLFELAEADICVLYATRFVVDEALRNIERKSPGQYPWAQQLALLPAIVAEPAPRAVRDAALHVVPKDAPILAGAAASPAQVLATGDRRHFGHLFGTRIDSVTILPLAQTLASILEQAPQ